MTDGQRRSSTKKKKKWFADITLLWFNIKSHFIDSVNGIKI